jgi:hypothetical protein
VRTAAARNYSVSGGVFIKKCLASKRFLQYGHGEDDPLVKLKSPFRFVIRPIVDYALELEKAYADSGLPSSRVVVGLPSDRTV